MIDLNKRETVEALLDIELFVTCPNKSCEEYIDLLRAEDTNDVDHDAEFELTKLVMSEDSDFFCDEVTCTKCKTVFNVKGLSM